MLRQDLIRPMYMYLFGVLVFGVLHAQKITVGKIFFLHSFFHYYFSIQIAYGTLKQNLVKFIYTEVINQEIKPSQSH